MARKRLSSEAVEEIEKLLKSGKFTQMQLAEKFDTTKYQIGKIAKDAGLSKDSSSTARLPKALVSKIIEMRNNGTPGIEIADQLGLQFSTVYRYLRKHKIGRYFGDGRTSR